MRQKGFTPIFILIIVVFVLGVLGFFAYTKGYLSFNLPKPSASTVPNSTPSPSNTPDPTANWKTYTDKKFSFSFRYPARYTIEKGIMEAIPEGEASFNAGSKEDRFWVDAVYFDGTLSQFINKYTAYDSGVKIVMTNLNISSPLGELVNQNNSNVRIYQYTNHYNQAINPGAKDIIAYTGFIVSNNFGYILRSANVTDNMQEFSQILSTFKFTQ